MFKTTRPQGVRAAVAPPDADVHAATPSGRFGLDSGSLLDLTLGSLDPQKRERRSELGPIYADDHDATETSGQVMDRLGLLKAR